METKTAAAYIRVSTEDQIEFSPDSQIKKIKEYAQHNNIYIDDEFIFMDEGISGRKAEKRPAFMKMITLAKTKPKPFDYILVWKFSRFARNREDSIVYKSMLRKQCGIDVISISEQIGEDKTSILIEALLEAMDEYYSINLAEEVKRGMNEKFSRAGVVTIAPFGYKLGDNVYVPNEETAPIVKMIFEDYANNDMGVKKIAMKLNDMGIRSIRGNLFENRTVEYIITNPVYIGKLRRNLNGKDSRDRYHQSEDNTIIDGKHEPIISEELFYKANEKLKYNKIKYGKYVQQTPSKFMLRGLCRCSTCGSTLVQSSRGNSLQCHKYNHGLCRVSHHVIISQINDAVLNQLKIDMSDINSDVEFKVIESTDSNSNADINSILIEKEYKKLERVKQAFESGIDTLEEYKSNKTRITNKILELEKAKPTQNCENKIQKLKTKISNVLQKINSDELDENDKNALLREIIAYITVDRVSKQKITIKITYLPI